MRGKRTREALREAEPSGTMEDLSEAFGLNQRAIALDPETVSETDVSQWYAPEVGQNDVPPDLKNVSPRSR